jgi:hypothetical protein
MREYTRKERAAILRTWRALEYACEQSTTIGRLMDAEKLDFASRGTDRATVRALLMDTIANGATLDGLASGHCVALGVRETMKRFDPAVLGDWMNVWFYECAPAVKAASKRAWDAAAANVSA